MTIDVRPLCEKLGVTVSGIDFAKPLDESLRRELYDLWLEYGLILIQGENITPDRQIAFSRLFGELEEHPLKTIRSKDYPELIELNTDNTRNNPVSYWGGEPVVGRQCWHKDLIYSAKPNRGAVLRAITIPESGGETGFGDQAAAYDALSDEMKARIEDLQVVFRFEVNLNRMPFLDTSDYRAGPDAPDKPADIGFPDFPDSLYPLVLTNPETGRKSLIVCPMFLDHVYGMDREEGDPLLQELVDHVIRPEFTYLHKWREGDMILWDNWRFMHSAPGVKPGVKRAIHRTTIVGDRTLGQTLEPGQEAAVGL